MTDGRWYPNKALRLAPRMDRAAVKVAKLGPRVLVELLTEIGARHDCLEDVAERLDAYATLSPESLRAAGADRMVNRRLRLVEA